MATSSLCLQIPRQPRCSILDPNAPEFIPRGALSDMLHFFDQASCRQSAQLGLEWVSPTRFSLPMHDIPNEQSSLSLLADHQNSRTDSSTNAFSTRSTNEHDAPAHRVKWESFVLEVDAFTEIVRHSLRVHMPVDVARVIIQFSRAQYELTRADTLLHEAYWTKDLLSCTNILDLCCIGSCAWIHPNLPLDVHQNFQVTAVVAFAPLFVRDNNIDDDYTSMSESEETFDLECELDPYYCDIDANENTTPNHIFVDTDFVCELPSEETKKIDVRQQRQRRCGRILSESLVSPRWEIMCEEIDSSGPPSPTWTVRITFNLWTHQIACDGRREFFKNSVSVSTVVNDSWSSFEWHNIMATWSRTNMEMSLNVDNNCACCALNGFLPCPAVVYDGSYQSREIAVGKDLLLSSDDENKFFGFVRHIGVDVWNDE